MTKSQLKKVVGGEKYGELVAHVEAQRAKGKGPDEIVASLRRKFPELVPTLVRNAILEIMPWMRGRR